MSGSMRKIPIFLFIITFSTTLVSAEKISGYIYNAKNQEPLLGANIYIDGTSLGTAANKDGFYLIPSVSPGNYRMIITYIGFEKKEIDIQVTKEENLKQNINLEPKIIQGNVIEVTAQAKGQYAAINEQVASIKITNIVSAEKMKELPDANVAESIGRLPGISLKRSSGEADKIVVRGLSPKYNNVTIDGVKMSSTNDFDRSVDLSLIQGDMLAGIEVMKSLTPDMDSDAIGGTINLRLSEAPKGIHYNVNVDVGYSDLESSNKSYKTVGAISNRLYDNKLGAKLQFSIEQKQLPSHKFSGKYSNPFFYQKLDSLGNLTEEEGFNIRTEGATLIDENTLRNRNSGNIMLDYKSDLIKIKFFNLINQKTDRMISRQNSHNFTKPAEPFGMRILDYRPNTVLRTQSLQNDFKLIGTELNIDFSYTEAKINTSGQDFDFLEVSDGSDPINQNWLIFRQPSAALKDYGQTKVEESYLQLLNSSDYQLEDENYDFRTDWHIPFKFSNNFSGILKMGGKYHSLKRESDNHYEFVDLRYGGGRPPREALVEIFPWIETNVGSQRGVSAINFLDDNYNPGSFLDSRYNLGWSADIELLTDLQDQFRDENDLMYFQKGYNSFYRDYTINEETVAGYVMTEINYGKKITIIPGFRYEKESTTYQAYQIQEQWGAKTGIVGNPDTVTVKRDNDFVFPSINTKFKLNEWSFLQAAIYKSTSRPDFRLMSPLVYITELTQKSFTSGNPYLKPSTAWNYDLGFSAFSNKIGLFSLNIYHKEIEDFIFIMSKYFPHRRDRVINQPDGFLDALPAEEYYDMEKLEENHKTNIPFNNFEDTYYKGIELSWQTNFWYLPGYLKGIVLDLNLTFLESKTRYPYFEEVVIGIDSSGWFPQDIIGFSYTTREGRMVDQPDAIYNLILGWDYKGFSSRLSFRYQDQTLQSQNSVSSLGDSFYDTFTLVDLSLKQKLSENLSMYLNMTNINNHIDDYFMQSKDGNPALPINSEHYGFRSQLSISYGL